ncbi:LysM peptidoglycan-binding domain-containing protein [Ornithinimicrobium humiphilum]|nr:LysM peptidoglycan-binding domain-containing protein [Ornithinimicrobium humiphilum]
MGGSTARAATLGAAGSLVMAGGSAWMLRLVLASWPGPGPVPVGAGLALLAGAGAALVAGWLAVVLAAAAWSLVPCAGGGPTTSRPRRPGGVTGRTAAALLVLASLGAAPAASAAPAALPAVAIQGTPPGTAAASTLPSGPAPKIATERPAPTEADEPVPVPGWTPTRAPAVERRAPAGEVTLVSTAGRQSSSEERTVVVRRGDSLWAIAARALGTDATDADVAAEWPRWWEANREVIGEDPDLIHPGQRLVAPPARGSR